MFFGAICLYIVIGALVFILMLDDLARKRQDPNVLCAVFCYVLAIIWPISMVLFGLNILFHAVWKWVESKGGYSS